MNIPSSATTIPVQHKESEEDATAVAKLDVNAKKTSSMEEHLKDYLITIENLLRGVLEASAINKQNYSEQLLEMIRPASTG